MEALITGVNWLAVGISTVLSFMLGGLWYSKMLFGKKWAEGKGIDTESGAGQPVPALVTQFVGTFLLAWIIALAMANNALSSAILIVITIAILLMAGSMFGGSNRAATIIEGGMLVTMAVIMISTNAIL